MNSKVIVFVFMTMMIVSLIQPVNAANLEVKDVSEDEIRGIFKVFLYGGRHGSDVETIAYLDPIEDEYEIELYTSDFNFRTEDKKDAKEALSIAKRFVSWHSSFMRFSVGKIVTSEWRIIGYEIKPLYMPFDFGMSDVFDISYWLRGKKAVISIKLIPSVERFIYDMGSSRDK